MRGEKFSASNRFSLQALLPALFPTPCVSCGEFLEGKEAVLCTTCLDLFTPLTAPCCPRCNMPFVSDYSLAASPSHLCGSCRESPPQFDSAVSGGEYGGPFRDLLHTFKFNQRPDLAPYIARIMIQTISLPDIDVIMAVPLHPRRLRARGYNQSLLLAREISRLSGIPLSIDDLTRVRATRPQMELHRHEREENVRGAFNVTLPAAVEGRRILLVDDVYTTGSTVRECAKALKKAGASAVFVATAAMVVR